VQVSAASAPVADRTTSTAREPDLPDRLDAFAERAGALLDRMIGARRVDSLARYALTIELATDPQLHRALTDGQPLREMAASALRTLGAPDPAAQALDLVSMTDGLVFDRLVGTRSLLGPDPGTVESVTELARAVRTYLRGVFGC
jgi:TetR/AcrR family transcriptional regulator, regulator of biofilm formation and stress response